MNTALFASRFVLGLSAVALLSLGGLRPASAQTVGNAGFEAPTVGGGSYGAFAYNPLGTPWTFSTSSGVSGNGSGFTSGNSNAPEGVQVGFVQQAGTISQSISGFSDGTYTFDFLSAQRVAGGNPGPDIQNFQVLVDGTALYGSAGLTPVGTSYQLYTTGSVALSAGTHTLTFQGLNTAAAGVPGYTTDNTAFIDGVGINKVAPVPEASSVISLGMLLALGLGGVAVARKKAVKA